ncbi:MAG: HD domain-containing protein [Lachnospiraceae bacterium]|nr:HD domain-containing protein [Lachnospiraceae bacterium]
MIFVKADELKYGMRLAKPIYNKMGVLLYERNTKLTMQGIESVKNFGLIGLYILEPAEPVPPLTEEDLEFERFQTMSIFAIKDDMNALIKGKAPLKIADIAFMTVRNYGSMKNKLNFTQNLRSTEDYIYKHSLNVAILAVLMAGKCGVPLAEQTNVALEALFHDIGKLGLPYDIRVKYDDYSEEDIPLVKKCLSDGMELLKPEYGIPDKVIRVLTQWHAIEYDPGSIPEDKLYNEVKILRVANAYDRMTAMKVKLPIMSDVAAVRFLLEHQDEFGEEYVAALVDSLHILYEGVCIELTNREKGLVIRENKREMLRPMVLGFDTNKIYDLTSDRVYSSVQIKDIMKTMDNRIIVDKKLLEEYKHKR